MPSNKTSEVNPDTTIWVAPPTIVQVSELVVLTPHRMVVLFEADMSNGEGVAASFRSNTEFGHRTTSVSPPVDCDRATVRKRPVQVKIQPTGGQSRSSSHNPSIKMPLHVLLPRLEEQTKVSSVPVMITASALKEATPEDGSKKLSSNLTDEIVVAPWGANIIVLWRVHVS